MEQVVATAIYDNFKNWSAVQTDGVKVVGTTLRQRLVKKRQDAIDEGDKKRSFGRKYYDMLKFTYAPEEDPAGKLLVRDSGEEVCARLSKSLARLRSATSDKVGCFATVPPRLAHT